MTTAGAEGMARPGPSIGRRMVLGAGWMVLVRFADRCLGVASTTILARLLVPEDFGIVALATSLIAVLEMAGELSVEVVLIRDQNAERRHYDTAWTVNIIKGVMLAGVLALLAAPAARFFSEPRVEAVIYWLCVSVVIGSFVNIGVVDFRKRLELHREFVYVMTSRTIATAITILLALAWREYWALVGGMVSRGVVTVLLSYLMASYRPRLSLGAFREVIRFSKWLVLENLLMGLGRRADALVLGRISDAQTLGHYTVAREISNLPTTEIEMPIRSAVFPGYAMIAGDRERLKTSFLNVFALVTAFAVPVAVGIGVTAESIVQLLLGPNWLGAIPLIEILSVYGLVKVSGGSVRLVFLALNKPYLSAMLAGVDLVVLLPLLMVGALNAGARGAALALVATALVTWVAGLATVTRLLDLALREIFVGVWRIGPGVAALIAAVGLVQGRWPASPDLSTAALRLAASVGAGAGAYVGAILGLWIVCGRPPGVEGHVLAAVRDAMRRFAPSWWARVAGLTEPGRGHR